MLCVYRFRIIWILHRDYFNKKGKQILFELLDCFFEARDLWMDIFLKSL